MYHKSSEMLFKNIVQSWGVLGKFLKNFLPSEMWKFKLCYTNCDVLEHEWIRTGITTLKE